MEIFLLFFPLVIVSQKSFIIIFFLFFFEIKERKIKDDIISCIDSTDFDNIDDVSVFKKRIADILVQ